MPLEFGEWETAYNRHRLWHDTGLWQRLLVALREDGPNESTEVTQ
jgi:transposase